MSAAASDELIAATDVADLLVGHGMPFREAHGVVAGLVRSAVDDGVALSSLDKAALASHSELLAAHARHPAQDGNPAAGRLVMAPASC